MADSAAMVAPARAAPARQTRDSDGTGGGHNLGEGRPEEVQHMNAPTHRFSSAPTRQASAPVARRRRARRTWRGSVAAALALGLLLVAAVPAAAVEDVATVTSGVTGEIDLEAIASFVEAAVPAAMDEHEAPGGVVVLVAEGRIVFAEGFGRTALEGGQPVDASRTRFDVGSVAKLVTASAVMQQVERGTLDLDEDVNSYLTTFEIPATYPEPVTTAHLLTHTAGFAEHFLVGMWAHGPGGADPLAESLARHRPERVRPPGVAHQYSNYGMSLAGHLVEVVTGQRFEDYVEEQVLGPLGMTRTTYGRPPAVDAVDAVPHSAMGGPTAAVEPAYVDWLPAGGLWTTGEDMAAFMLAHLPDGAHDGQRLLEPSTVEAMQRTQFSAHPAVAGLGYGFFGDHRGGIQHGGGWMGAGAHVHLRPDLGLGLFSAFNHDDGPLLASRLHDEIAERFLPAGSALSADPVLASATTPATGSYAGGYRWNRHDRSSFASVFSTLMISWLEVAEHPDGTLTTTMSPAPFIVETRWVPSEPGVFVEDGGTNVLAFDLDLDGRATGLHVMGAQLFSMDRVGAGGSSGASLVVLLAISVLLLLVAIAWPVGALVRRLRRRGGATSAEVRRVRRLSGVAAAVASGFVVGLVVHVATDMAGLLQVSATLRGLLWLPLLAAVLTAALAVLVGRLWWCRDGTLTARLYHSVVLVALLGFLPLLHSLRLLGFHY
jgi:CubicO group peptidase (beta-lactamase class C family)